MGTASDKDIVQRTREAFAPLIKAFGFEEPEAERLRYELYVRYHRGDETISIQFDAANPPQIEMLLPVARTSHAAVPEGPRFRPLGSARCGCVRKIPRQLRADIHRKRASVPRSCNALILCLQEDLSPHNKLPAETDRYDDQPDQERGARDGDAIRASSH